MIAIFQSLARPGQDKNLWWENIIELEKYMIEEINNVFALNPLIALK